MEITEEQVIYKLIEQTVLATYSAMQLHVCNCKTFLHVPHFYRSSYDFQDFSTNEMLAFLLVFENVLLYNC